MMTRCWVCLVLVPFFVPGSVEGASVIAMEAGYRGANVLEVMHSCRGSCYIARGRIWGIAMGSFVQETEDR